jgi:hypothetical protein
MKRYGIACVPVERLTNDLVTNRVRCSRSFARCERKEGAMRQPKVTGYDGRHDKFIPDDHGGGTVEWQPGDGTRYLIVAKVIDEAEARIHGAIPGSRIVSVGPGGAWWLTMIVIPWACHHISYVAEYARDRKMSDYTLLACTALMNLALGDEAYGIELFEEMIKGRG